MNKWIIVSAGIVSAGALFSVSCFFLYWAVWNIIYNRGPDGVAFALNEFSFGGLGLAAGAVIVRKVAVFLRRQKRSTIPATSIVAQKGSAEL